MCTDHPASTTGTGFIIDQQSCTFCGGCVAVCPRMAIQVREHAATITDRCNRCGRCLRFCPVLAIHRGSSQ